MYPSDLRERLAPALDPAPAPVPGPEDRLAAVLVPIMPDGALVFTRRAANLSRHPGEISFPGGLQHAGDRDLAATALRETQEELGLSPVHVEVLGALTPVHTFVSAIVIVPFVGLVVGAPPFVPNDGEIAEVLRYDLAALDAAEALVEWEVGDHIYRGYAYEMPDGHTIWGATAWILHALMEIARPMLEPRAGGGFA